MKKSDEINQRVIKLQRLGLEPNHNEYVMFVTQENEHMFLDFQNVPESEWLLFAMEESFKAGKERGREELRSELNNLLRRN
jgi:hypothetical protein